jgi:hypothetical protein
VKALPTMDELSAVVAYEETVCADKPHVKNLLLRAGLTSTHKLVQSMALSEALMGMETVVIETEKAPVALVPFFRDRKNNCISFQNGRADCTARIRMSIDGVSVTFHYEYADWMIGQFTLNQEGNLAGSLSTEKGKSKATILLNAR